MVAEFWQIGISVLLLFFGHATPMLLAAMPADKDRDR